jgi:autotransporter-associated beta strand protein
VTLADPDSGADNAALLATAVMNDSFLGQISNQIVVAAYGSGSASIGTTAFTADSGAGAALQDRSTTFGGTLTLGKATTLQPGNSDRTAFTGGITGSSISVGGGARVVLSHGANFDPAVDVSIRGAGTTLQIEGDGAALSSAHGVSVGSGATLALASDSPLGVIVRSLSGAGRVVSALPGTPQTLVVSDAVGGGNFSGSIADGASQVSLFKIGFGTQTLSGINAYTGYTLVKQGTLVLANSTTNNSIASSSGIILGGATLDVTGLDKGALLDTLVLANGQSLVGSGTVTGRVQVLAGSTLKAAGSFPSYFSTGDVALTSGSTLAATINGTESGLQGQLNVQGAVSLGDAALSLTGIVDSSPHQEIVLIQNDGVDPVAGTFHGLPEGAIVSVDGVKFSLSYRGGDGNDVTLAQERPIYAVAAGGLPVVHVYNAKNGAELFSITAYEPKYRAGIRVAVADMNGDGYDDIITTTPTGTGRLRVFDGLTGQRFTSGPFANEIAVFDGRLDKGTFVAAGDLTGDGRADLLIGSALGGGKVRVFDGVTGAPLTFTTGQTFFQPFGKTFKGGIRVAAGDLNGDGVSELVLAQNYYGARVAAYDAASLFATPGAAPAPVASPIFSFNFGAKTYRAGVNVATGDFDHDGRADLLVGSNAGPTYVQAYSGLNRDATGVPLAIGGPIYPFDKTQLKHLYTRGVRVAAMDVDGDGIADIIAASSGLAKSVVNIYSGKDHSLLRSFPAFPTLPNSALFVAGSA